MPLRPRYPVLRHWSQPCPLKSRTPWVSVTPMASGLNNIEDDGSRESAALQGLVRMFGVLLMLQALALVANYL